MKTDEQKLNDKWENRKLIEETVKSMNLHTEPAPETREKLAILFTNQANLMEKLQESIDSNKEEHQGLRELIKEINNKLDSAINKKADKELVDSLKATVDDLKTWKIKIAIIGSILLFLVTFLKDEILLLIKHI